MTILYSGIIILSLFCRGDTTTTRRWPIVGASDKIITSNLGDYRDNHFHLGIDIPAQTASVRSYSKTFLYLSHVYHPTYYWFVCVDHYSDDSSSHMISGSQYIHMNTIDTLLEDGTVYSDVNLANNTGFLDNHLHFDFYTPSADTAIWEEAMNPMAQDSLEPLDYIAPILDKMYVDGSFKGSATISCLNYLGYFFDSLYADTTDPVHQRTFKKLKLHDTPNYDLDDPHIIISDNCDAKFIVRCYDNFSAANDRGAPYELGLYLDRNIVDCIFDHFKIRFDFIAWSDRNKEEYIYHMEPPCSTIFATDAQFHRLYHYDTNLPSCIVSQDILRTENLDEGMHRIRIYAKDYHQYTITGDVHFYVRRSSWVDFCRGFKE